jgi:predicted RNA-binding Zn-ribbon protein involved in translation (DUF1610 family)
MVMMQKLKVTCPCCQAEVSLARESVRVEFFLCPVCEEGEIANG